jgi:hypothetical protein
MQAGGSDAAEICPDIAAIGEPRAVAHHQAAEQRGEERPAAPPRRRTAPWRAGGLKRRPECGTCWRRRRALHAASNQT